MNSAVSHRLAAALCALTLLCSGGSLRGVNLVVNGSFDNTNSPLFGWKYNYEDTGNSNYSNNHHYVSVTNFESGKSQVLDLRANWSLLWKVGQGVMVDSDPIPVAPNGRFKLTVSARSTGCNARIFVEGYRWRPGIKPHPKPKLEELRKCYRFPLINFEGGTPGTMSMVGETWKRASQIFPEGKMTKLGKESFDRVQFLVVHIIAIDLYNPNVPPEDWFHLYVDDVVVERLN